MIGQTLKGRYKIIKDLKKAAFGKTYLTEDRVQHISPLSSFAVGGSPPRPSEEPSRPTKENPKATAGGKGELCVLRKLQPNTTNPFILAEARRRFQEETTLLEKLGQHPQLPALVDYFEENQQFYLVQEFIEGTDLGKEISGGKRWSENQVIAMMHDVLEILEFIHQHQVIHRQIKPSNLIRRKSDRKIAAIDFGSVKEIETLVITAQGQMTTATLGTPGYIPREQLGGKPRLNSDIYALGITAIQALTGVHPRKLERDAQSGQVIWQDLAPVSEQLTTILNKMVLPDYKARYQSATEVLNDLRSLHKIGYILGKRYKILSLLGEGTFGNTFIAADQQLANTPLCVVKQLKPHASSAFPFWEARSLFDTEAQILYRLGSHDQIPRLLGDFQENQEFYLVHEFIEGENLSQEIYPGKKWSEPQAIAMLRDILETLVFVHQQDVIHCDLKPSNLIRREKDGKIVLTDFGSVKHISTLAVDEIGNLKSSVPVGTPGYMPPEQLSGNVRPNSDIYALGAIAIFALTGIRPDQLEINPHTGELSWLMHAQISDPLADILEKMVRAYFRARYQSVTEVLNDLRYATAAFDQGESESKPSSRKRSLISGWLRYVKPWHVYGSRISGWLRSVKPWHILLLLAIAGATVVLGNLPQKSLPTSQADKLVSRANQLMGSLSPGALDLCEEAIALQPNYPPALNCKGDALYAQERYEEALEEYKKASNLSPKNAQFWNKRGEALYQLQRYKEALDAHDKAKQIQPSDPDAWNGRGIALIGLTKYSEALTAFDEAIALNRADPKAWEKKGLALEYQRRSSEARQAYEAALAAYDSLLKTNPDDASSWVDRGRVLSKLQRPEEALASYEKALEINPKFYSAWKAKGNIYYSKRRYKPALEAYTQAVEINPELYTAWYNKGSVLSAGLQRYKEAIAAFDKALNINPKLDNAWRERGIALSAIQQYKEAIASFDKALKINPNDYKSWASRGLALAELKLYSEAIASYDKALKIQPKDHLAWYNRGLAQGRLEQYAEAIASYDKAIEIQPDFQPAIEARGWLIEFLGEEVQSP